MQTTRTTTDWQPRICLILNTGRCGGTVLSNIVRAYPDALSISEFFSALRGHDLTERMLSGTDFWHMLSTPGHAETEVLARCGIEPEELLYPLFKPRPGARRFVGGAKIPPVLQVTIPHLTGQPDELYATLEVMAVRQPRRMLSQHLLWLFGVLAGGRRPAVVVERSGGSLAYAGALLRLFPEAKVVHLFRDGRECAVSMSRHACFKLAAIRSMLSSRFAYDPYGVTEAATDTDRPRPKNTENDAELGELAPERITRERFERFRVPLSRYGGMWSRIVATGLAELPEPSRVLSLDYRDVAAKPGENLDLLFDFLGIAHHSEWTSHIPVEIRAARDVRAELCGSEWDELTRSCSFGMNRIYGRGGWK